MKRLPLKLQTKLFLARLAFPLISSRIDCVILGYPKTGNTWLAELLRMALAEHYGTPPQNVAPHRIIQLFNTCKRIAPIVFPTHNIPDFHTTTASSMHINNHYFQGKKAVILHRDPKDTLVSLYMHGRYREHWNKYLDVNQFVHDTYYGLNKLLSYYRQLARDAAIFSHLHPVSYESLRQDTAGELARITEFLGINVPQTTIASAVEYCSLERMRARERAGESTEYTLHKPSNPSDRRGYKVREGKVGGYSQHLNAKTIEFINRRTTEEFPSLFKAA